jgi:hypothetical protein
MTVSYLPVEPFDVERVRFFVHGSIQPLQGALAPLYSIVSKITGRQTLSLELVALVDQESAHSMTAMDAMGKYGAKYLKQARKLARAQGYLVTSTEWGGIISPHNLQTYQNAPNWTVWEFPRKRKR